jgi:rare lipoprotein A
MSMRTTLRTPLLGALVAAGLAVPAAAAAAPSPGGAVAPQGSVVLTSGAHVLAGRPARVRGFVPSGDAGRDVRLERLDAPTGAWVTEGAAVAAADGGFTVRWRSGLPGRVTLRAVVDHGGEASAATASDELAVTVYQPAKATWYGPGFYGRRTACGQTMTRTLLGVAHRRLPCGTLVAISHRGRGVVVPVVDRGPFGTDAEWDLTAATAQAVGLTRTALIGALPQR